ncbi:hypothetical protein B0H13DRAFT_2363809 [Mycena leptocephala]|nr:hypothetical protein B0H13DRAFT_2363809 [Mycena leptocephala]
MRLRASPSSEFSEDASNLPGPTSLGDLGGGAFSHERRRPNMKAASHVNGAPVKETPLTRCPRKAGWPPALSLSPFRTGPTFLTMSPTPSAFCLVLTRISLPSAANLFDVVASRLPMLNATRLFAVVSQRALPGQLSLIWAVIFALPVQQCFRLRLEPSSASTSLSSSVTTPPFAIIQ